MSGAAVDLPAGVRANPRLDTWVRIDADGTFAIRSGKVEIGQGIGAAMLAIAAGELGVSPTALRLLPLDTDAGPDEGVTAGSLSVEQGGAALRMVCAMVRTLFADAAARQFDCTAEDVVFVEGVFRHPDRNAAVRYADLAGAVNLAVSALDLPAPRLRGPAAPDATPRPDLPGKLSGAAYIQDLRLPGMAFGRVLRPAAAWLALDGFDAGAVRAMPGVLAVVQDGGFAGVVADSDAAARAALASAKGSARWRQIAPHPPVDEPAMDWLANLPGETLDVLSDPGPRPGSAQRLTAGYARPYLLHASIGPSCAVADWADGRLTVHTHSQGVFPLRRQLARVFDLAPEAVRVIHAAGAGCYGHNPADDVAFDAALMARAAGRPVMVLWSREDEMSWAPHGAAMRTTLEAGLDESGRISDWRCLIESCPHVARPGSGEGVDLLAAGALARPFARSTLSRPGGADRGADRNAVPLYRVGPREIRHRALAQGPLRSSALRSLGAHGNVFAIESFMDELAAAAGADPLAFRLAHCDDPRATAVLRTAAQAAGWTAGEAGGDGHGRGLAVARYKGSAAYFACVVKVSVDVDVRLTAVHAAVDAGRVIHRDGLENQIEGGIVQAASWTLKERAGWTRNGFAVRGWPDYPILGFAETPPIDVTILPSEAAPLGAGECAAGPVAAAIANAVAHALGVRIRTMPITRDRIMDAIAVGTV